MRMLFLLLLQYNNRQLLPLSCGFSQSSPSTLPPTRQWIKDILHNPPSTTNKQSNERPLTRTVLFGFDQNRDDKKYQDEERILTTTRLSPHVVYRQKSTDTQIQGLTHLQAACAAWDAAFAEQAWWYDDDNGSRSVESAVTRVTVLPNEASSSSSCTLRVFWNVTWVNDFTTIASWPCRERVYMPYTHLASQVSTFSWRAVGEVLSLYIRTGVLRIPLACIQGVTDVTLERQSQSLQSTLPEACSLWHVTRIEEDVLYALDLQQGRLLNRKCAADLRLFLEIGRCRHSSNTGNDDMQQQQQDAWYDHVATALPFGTVPGSNVLDVDGNEEGPQAAVVFLGVAATTLLLVANWLAPELIGQSLF